METIGQGRTEKELTNFQKWALKKRYNMDSETFIKMEAAQKGVCYICQRENVRGRRLAVDHCHKTLKVRKLLCNRCNMAIGGAKESPRVLLKMVGYVLRHNLLRC